VTKTIYFPSVGGALLVRWAGGLGCLLALLQTGFSQEAVRASLAGEAAAAAKRKAATTIGYHNLKMGDLRLRLHASTELEANDNVNLSDQDPRSDLIVRPQARGTFLYPLTERNSLNLTIGAGYAFYLREDNLSRYFITPGSELSFDVFVGDCLINIHDRVSVSQDAYENPAATGSGNIGTFDNMAGVSATWDLHDVVLTTGYDHLLRRSTTSGFSQQNATSHAVHGSGGLKVNSFTIIGVDLGATLIERETQSGGVQYNIGLSYRSQISQYLSVRAALGYTLYQLDNPAPGQSKDLNAIYGSLAVQHRVNRIVSYSLEAGRDVQIGLFSDILDLYFARLQANWNLIHKVSLGTHLSYEWGTESGGAGDEITRYGGGISVGRGLTEKLSARLYYDLLVRNSNLPGREYLQNRVGLSLAYAF